MFRSILCPVDFSRAGERAIEHAIAWAAHDRAELELFHAVRPTIEVTPEIATMAIDLDAAIVRALEERMSGLVESVRARAGDVRGRVVRGFPSTEIVNRAAATHADLIVMGTTGAGAVARVLLGSVADRVLRTTPIPLLLVPQEGRVVSPIPKRILASTDFSSSAKATVSAALALADALGASLDVVHAYDLPAFVARNEPVIRSLGAAMAVEMHAEHPDLVERANVRVRALEGPPAETLVSVADATDADLVVMSPSGRRFVSALLLGSVTDRVIRTAHVPVLVMRAREAL